MPLFAQQRQGDAGDGLGGEQLALEAEQFGGAAAGFHVEAAEAFDQAGALDKLEGFASFHGADYYGLPRNTDTITLRRESWTVPETVPYGDATLKPLRGGETVAWRLE